MHASLLLVLLPLCEQCLPVKPHSALSDSFSNSRRTGRAPERMACKWLPLARELAWSIEWCMADQHSFYFVHMHPPTPTVANTDTWLRALELSCSAAQECHEPASVLLAVDIQSFADLFNWVPSNATDVLRRGAPPAIHEFFANVSSLLRQSSAAAGLALLLNYANEWREPPHALRTVCPDRAWLTKSRSRIASPHRCAAIGASAH